MAASVVTVPLSVYLETTWRPDRDWVDGELRERNMGEGPHASVQGFLIGLFRAHGLAWGTRVFPEQRVQTSERHYRIADVCVTRRSAPFERIVRVPPLLCVEVFSKDDRMKQMRERVADYLGMGVETVWLVDPQRRQGFVADAAGVREVSELVVAGTEIRVGLEEVFEELDELEGLTASEG